MFSRAIGDSKMVVCVPPRHERFLNHVIKVEGPGSGSERESPVKPTEQHSRQTWFGCKTSHLKFNLVLTLRYSTCFPVIGVVSVRRCLHIGWLHTMILHYIAAHYNEYFVPFVLQWKKQHHYSVVCHFLFGNREEDGEKIMKLKFVWQSLVPQCENYVQK